LNRADSLSLDDDKNQTMRQRQTPSKRRQKSRPCFTMIRLSFLSTTIVALSRLGSSHAFVPSSLQRRATRNLLIQQHSNTRLLQLQQRAAAAKQETASSGNNNNKGGYSAILERIATVLSQRYNAQTASPAEIRSERDRRRVSLLTLLRVGIPSILAGAAAYLLFPALALSLATAFNDPGVFAVLSQDSSQFVQNFLTVAGLLFSILVGQTCELVSKI